MDQCIDGWIDQMIYESMDPWIDRSIYSSMVRWFDGLMDQLIGGPVEGRES